MKLAYFDYHLPEQLIAQKPVYPRDHSRLMVLDKQKKTISHRHFYDLPDYLKKGDVLVLNNTKVFPARLIGKRKDTGGKAEVFLLKKHSTRNNKQKNSKLINPKNKIIQAEVWEVLIDHRRKKLGQTIQFGKGLECQIVKKIDESVWEVKFNKQGKKLEKLINILGQVPIPPYIKLKGKSKNLKNQYQTVFAKEKGSVAAPTAGFHFTKPLLNKLKKKGVQIEYVTLHVGLGTFAPVKVDDIIKHRMHSEWASIDLKTAKRLNKAKQAGRRIIAVGTTTARTLEAFSRNFQKPNTKKQKISKPQISNFKLLSGNKWTDIFIYPGYKFKFVDSMITNFHLPKSTLMMLISALAGRSFIFKAYQLAIKNKYRFYSFGDAMLIE